MTRFEFLIDQAIVLREKQDSALDRVLEDLEGLYEGTHGTTVRAALGDPFFPLTLYRKHHLHGQSIERAARDLVLLSRMFLRIREDINRFFDNATVTCVNLDGDARQRLPSGQWCTLCGECCQLRGTVPDPPDSIRYPGYWYSYIAGDSPVAQRFCPFLFELSPQKIFFCAIHNIKPRTCLAYGREDCLAKHPGKARQHKASAHS